MRVDYPIAVDNDYAIWNGFANQYWPALYIIDAQGAIRHRQFGEGGYVEAERIIQQLLREAGFGGGSVATWSRSTPGYRGSRGLGQPPVSGELPQLEAH